MDTPSTPPEEEPLASPPPVHMKKELQLLDGVGIIVGIIIGSGIFVSPTGVLEYCGSVGMSLTVWGITGLLSMIGAFCYAELGTTVPKSGGDYAYIFHAFGPLPAFLYLWVALVIIMPTGNTIVALTFANYVIQPIFSDCPLPSVAVRLIAGAVICLLTWINCTSVKWATKIQNVFTLTKVFALSIIIFAGIYYLALGHTENYQNPMEGTNWRAASIATAFYQGLFSFAGWNLPLAILISMPLVTVVYFLANVAYFAVLTPSEILSSNAVAVQLGNQILGVMAWIMPFFVACSTFGSLNGGIFASSRLFFVGARQNHLPEAFSLISTTSYTPVFSLCFLGFMTLVMLVSVDVQVLINYISFSETLFILMSIASLLWIRYKEPKRHRPIKIWIGFPIFFFVVCLVLLVFPVLERPVELGVAIAVIISGIPVYYLGIQWKSKPEWLITCTRKFTRASQILCISLPEEKEN